VRTSAGAAAAGVPVELMSQDGSIGHTTTDGAGAYRFDWVGEGDRYRVRAGWGSTQFDPAWVTTDGRGSASWVPQPVTELTVGSANLAAPALTLYRPSERRTLTVTAVDATGAPRAGVELRVVTANADRTLVAIVRTDATGKAAIWGLRPDLYAVWAPPASTGTATGRWYRALAGGYDDGSGQLADPLDVRTADAAVTMALA
jgi:hypothetical protein